MFLEVRTKVIGIDSLKQRLVSFLANEGTQALAGVIITEIRKDAANSTGYDGKVWPELSEGWKLKKSRGITPGSDGVRITRGATSGKRDLWYTGTMLPSLHLAVNGNKKEITVRRDQLKKAEGNAKRSPFIGMSAMAKLKGTVAIAKAWRDKFGKPRGR